MTELIEKLEKELSVPFDEQQKNGNLTPERVARQSLGWPMLTAFQCPKSELTGQAFAAVMIASNIGLSDDPVVEKAIIRLCRDADRSIELRRAAAGMIVMFSEKGQPLPLELAQLAADFLAGKKLYRRPRGRPKDTENDEIIAEAVSAVIRWFPDINATRNEATARPSACSIVAAELALLRKESEIFPAIGERAVQTKWERCR